MAECTNKKVRFTLELGSWDVGVEELWPDGDAPENPTVEDVHKLIKKAGGVRSVLSDWGLVCTSTEFDVYHYTSSPPNCKCSSCEEKRKRAREKLIAKRP